MRVTSQTVRDDKPPVRVEIGSFGVMQNSAIRLIDGVTVTMDTPFVYWSVPERICAWRTIPGTVRTNTWFSVTGERVWRMYRDLRQLSEYDMLPVMQPLPFLTVIRQIEHLLAGSERRQDSQIKIAVLVERFVAEIYLHAFSQQGQGRYAQQIAEIARTIREFPADEYDFRRIAARLGVSYEHFRFLFHEHCGSSLHEFCLQARLDAALEMLASSPVQIQEVVEQCGFRNASDFARFFRKRIGCSPSAYRRSMNV